MAEHCLELLLGLAGLEEEALGGIQALLEPRIQAAAVAEEINPAFLQTAALAALEL